MNMKLLATVFACGISISVNASAITVDFNNYEHTSTANWGGISYIGSTISVDGFFINSCYGRCGPDNFAVYGMFDPYQADYGHAAVLVWHADTPISISRTDGQAFDFYSIDFGPSQLGFGVDNELTFTYANGETNSVRTGISNSPEAGLRTFVFDQSNVVSVYIRGWSTTGVGQFDNLVLNEIPSPVPEPSNHWFMIAGLSIIGALAAKKKRAAKAE